ncbi:MAG: N-6 DNA methylase [Deltaproteobacteria bacterium]|nr:N-6 DNA methylase [Deltaproteobacteria bacterium]
MSPRVLQALARVCPPGAPEVERYLRRCGGVGQEVSLPLADEAGVDETIEAAWRERPADGRVYTPRRTADRLLSELGYPGEGEGWLLDPSCGAGVFLLQAAERLAERFAARGLAPLQVALAVLAGVRGVDLDPEAVALARVLLGAAVAARLPDPEALAELPVPLVLCGDALEPETTAAWMEREPPRWIAGNPPYLEAKRMPSAQRATLRAAWRGRLFGAWDLYVLFLERALEWRPPGGVVGFVLPNKVLVARYAQDLRARLLAQGLLRGVIDLSEEEVFTRVGVYPVLLLLGEGPARYRSALGSTEGVEVPYALPLRLIDPPVLFTLDHPALPGLLDRLLRQHPPLGEALEVRSTVSFHQRGLRERYVRPGDALPEGIPYLGGRSYARRSEVRPFHLDWSGYRIDPAAWGLPGHPLPTRDRFAQPKIIFCQHARSMVAAADPAGRFVTKDVFPVAIPRQGGEARLLALTAVLGSRVFSVLYSLFFRGIQVGGRYLHFLPLYLRAVPLPTLSDADCEALAALGVLVGEGSEEAQELLDGRVEALYRLSPEEARVVRRWADEVLGFGGDPRARR